MMGIARPKMTCAAPISFALELAVAVAVAVDLLQQLLMTMRLSVLAPEAKARWQQVCMFACVHCAPNTMVSDWP